VARKYKTRRRLHARRLVSPSAPLLTPFSSLPSSWVSTAAANAAGAASGSYVLLLLLRSRGEALLTDYFGSVLANPAYAKLMGLMKAYGVAGMLGVSAMPLILHPIIVFGVVSGVACSSSPAPFIHPMPRTYLPTPLNLHAVSLCFCVCTRSSSSESCRVGSPPSTPQREKHARTLPSHPFRPLTLLPPPPSFPSGMSDLSIIGIILAGRTLKYLIMAWVTKNAPGALRYFGIRASLLDMAAQAKAE
jgi:hypothetical protein